jgi:AcrR family transcriptional regulator
MVSRPGQARDAEATRRRLLDAAAAEFSEHGFAGARVSRIATVASSNAAQIYHYFGSKEGLFNAVFTQLVVDVVDADYPMDVADLGEYAGRLFDGWQAHPELARLLLWQRLERRRELNTESVRSSREKVAAIAQAQRDGVIADRFSAGELLGLIIQTAALWVDLVPEVAEAVAIDEVGARRDTVVRAVRALL